MMTPPAKRKVQVELQKVSADLRSKIAPPFSGVASVAFLPAQGKDLAWIEEELDKLRDVRHDANEAVIEGKVSGAVYHGHQDGVLEKVIESGSLYPVFLHARSARLTPESLLAIHRFILSNPLHPDLFPGVRKVKSPGR